jgi:hypothetical protein
MAERAAPTRVWRRHADALTRRTPRSILVVGPDSDEPLKLEGASAFVWEALAEPATDEQLVVAIGARFARAPQEVRDDVVTARVALAGHGLLLGSDA